MDHGDIIGFSNLYPNTNIVQDTGYKLKLINKNITNEPQQRGLTTESYKAFGSSRCDSVMGCAMFIKKEVINSVKEFKLDGLNRWGELIFCYQAIKMGYKVTVVDHFLFHHGKSTKVNPNKNMSSESYAFEKKYWDAIVKKYFDKNDILNEKSMKMTPKLNSFLKHNLMKFFFLELGQSQNLL